MTEAQKSSKLYLLCINVSGDKLETMISPQQNIVIERYKIESDQVLGFLGYIKSLCEKRRQPAETPKPRKFQTVMPVKKRDNSKTKVNDPLSPITKKLDN